MTALGCLLGAAGGVKGAERVSLTELQPEAESVVGEFELLVNKNPRRKPVLLTDEEIECTEYIFSAAPSTIVYSVPRGCRYFGAVMACLRKPYCRFRIVDQDGMPLFSGQALMEYEGHVAPVILELPEDCTAIQLKTIPLLKTGSNWSMWCYPAFYREMEDETVERYQVFGNVQRGRPPRKREKPLPEGGEEKVRENGRSGADRRLPSDARQGKVVDLLKLVQPDVHGVKGHWRLDEGALVSDETNSARISFPYRPPAEYDVGVRFVVASPLACTAVLCSKGDTAFTYSMNAGRPRRCRLEDIDGHSVIGNPTKRAKDFAPGKVHTCIVRVREAGVAATINGETMLEYETDYGDLSRNRKWRVPRPRRLGVGTWHGPTRFLDVQVREISGRGRILREQDDDHDAPFAGNENGGIEEEAEVAEGGPVLVLWNLPERDRATLRASVSLYRGDKRVYEREGIELEYKPGVCKPTRVRLPDREFDRLRIGITRYYNLGGGLAEVQLFADSQPRKNLLLNAAVEASGPPSYHLCTPDNATDGTTEKGLANIWTLKTHQTGWLEIDLTAKAKDWSEANRIPLTELKPVSASLGWERLRVSNAPGDRDFQLKGQTCDVYLFAATGPGQKPSKLVYRVPEGVRYFAAVMGSLLYHHCRYVIEDGEYNILFRSRILNEYPDDCAATIVKIPKGTERLVLRILSEKGGGGQWSAWAWPAFYRELDDEDVQTYRSFGLDTEGDQEE